MRRGILIVDFGSQYTQLIARRIREFHVYCEIYPFKKINSKLFDNIDPSGVILSGGPNSVLDKKAPKIHKSILESKIPILAIFSHFRDILGPFGPILGQNIFLSKIRIRHFSRLTKG